MSQPLAALLRTWLQGRAAAATLDSLAPDAASEDKNNGKFQNTGRTQDGCGAATAALKAIPDGKVVDFVSGRLLDDTPEEYVRQNVEMRRALEYSYPGDQVEVEFRIKVGSGTKRVDLALFAPGAAHTQDNIQTIIETKREGTKRGRRQLS